MKKMFAGALALALLAPLLHAAPVPVVSTTSVVVRVMAANITTGTQDYEEPGLRIFKGLKPDVVAIQEFNYTSTNGAGINTSNAFREMVSSAFGTNFTWFRETNPSGGSYSIPNGIISRWPIRAAGSWVDDDTGVNDRGFAWAIIDLPGTNELYVVSIHLKASSGDANAVRREAEAQQIKGLIQSTTNIPAGAFLVVAGDCNIDNTNEAALATFKTYLSDSLIPTDPQGDADTNRGRDERYDYVFTSPSLDTNRIATVIGAQSFPNGLVFDSRTFTPTNAVSPVQTNDSGAVNMQHMAVVKDFRISYTATNFVTVPPPVVQLVKTNVLRWPGLSNLTYTVQTSSTLSNWLATGAATSPTTNFLFTNSQPATNRRFYRVVYP